MLGRSVLFAFSVISFLIFLSSCTAERKPIKIGINQWPGYEFLNLAKEKGFYDQQGVLVKIIEYSSLSDVRRGYERGNLDAMAVTLIEVLQVTVNTNKEPKVILITDFSNGSDMIVAKKSISNVAQLKGKKVAADTISLPIFMLSRALEISGLSLDDIELLNLEQAAMGRAYANGEIDAAVTYPPLSVELLKRDDSHVIFSSSDIPGEIVDVLAVEDSVLKNRPDDIMKIFRAWSQSLEYAKENPEEAYRIMSAREGISPSEFSDALKGLSMVPIAQQEHYFASLPDTLKMVRRTLIKTGALSEKAKSDCCVSDIHSSK